MIQPSQLFFVVPLLSSTWCFLAAPKCWVRCGGLRPLRALLPLLIHYNATTADQHLFLGSDSTGDLSVDLQMQPLVLSYGPNPCGSDAKSGPVIIPPPVTDELPRLDSRIFASKDIFIFTADGVGGRPFRREAIEELERWQRRSPATIVVGRRGTSDLFPNPSPAEWALMLRRSVFCPVLPGDNTFRMRLFHAVLAGCIPVVIGFPGGGWYRTLGPAVENSLPFPTRIDWHGIAVALPHDPQVETFRDWAKQLVPSLLRISPNEMQALQVRLAAAAPLLRYDFSGSEPDAFTAILDELALRAEVKHSSRSTPLECFDPRKRFKTQRILSGATSVELEEREVFGVVACCPVRSGGSDQTSTIDTRGQGPCNIGVRGRCMRFRSADTPSANTAIATNASVPDAEETHLRAHVAAVFSRMAFYEERPEDLACMA